MRLSEINDYNFTNHEIQNIVYGDIDDNGQNTKYGLVFGNSIDAILKARIYAAVLAYKNNRIKKIILSGNGSKNPDNDGILESDKMKDLAIRMGIPKDDIIIEDKSNNSVENIEYSFNLIKEPFDSIAVITSEFHLKRCKAIINKMYPYINTILISAKDGFTDSDNWYLSEEGKKISRYEVRNMVVQAKRDQMIDLDINLKKVSQK